MAAIGTSTHGLRSIGKELIFSKTAKAFSDLRFFSGEKKWGRNISENKVVPTIAKDANIPKSLKSSLDVKSSPAKAPMVVRQPKMTGSDSSASTLRGLLTYL